MPDESLRHTRKGRVRARQIPRKGLGRAEGKPLRLCGFAADLVLRLRSRPMQSHVSSAIAAHRTPGWGTRCGRTAASQTVRKSAHGSVEAG